MNENLRSTWPLVVSCLVASCFMAASADAHEPKPTTVPPSLEIEILDPGVDPLGNPAVVVRQDGNGQMCVDIPPVVLVHRYYYSGNRSFQGPMLPGGPSIAVLNHPKTGERCYIPLQLMPGAPRVTYTGGGIEYDYGNYAATITFPLLGQPKVKYRNGPTIHQKVATAVHAEQVREHAQSVAQGTQTVATVAAAGMHNTAKAVGGRLGQVISIVPFGRALTTAQWKQRAVQHAEQFKREKAIRKAQKQAQIDELTYPTIR